MAAPRFLAQDAQAAARLRLSEDAAHHARAVLRLRLDDPVVVFDGRGHEYDARVVDLTARAVEVAVGAARTPRAESALAVTLALAALKGDRMEWALQKAVELGVSELRPLVTARTDAAARPALQGSRDARWQRVLVGAAEQCGRAVVPRLLPTVELPTLLQATPAHAARLFFFEGAEGAGLRARQAARDVLAVVGPEGGFSADEVALARAQGFEVTSLGPRVLRAETAALAALSVLQALWGDLA
jgi:16S rRNA (uracil1498-N3)-methyltransferase